MKEAALRAASTQGGAGAFGARPPCVDSFMDECVAVAVAEAVAVAVTEAVAEADQSIHDQSFHDPSIRAGCGGQKLLKSARGGGARRRGVWPDPPLYLPHPGVSYPVRGNPSLRLLWDL